jgi:DNA-directed RNA polymerase subunit RPC12/RpoP
MAQKTVGYVELEWVCPNCGSRNKGAEKICSGCGAAQPADVQFQQPAEEKLNTNPDAAPSQGADIHCPFCAVRNPGSAKVCVNCGGDLTSGQKRETGRVLGAYRDQAAAPVACPACGENNPPANLRCARCGAPLPGAVGSNPTPTPAVKKPFPVVLVIGLLAGAVLLIVLFSLLFSKHELTAHVIKRSWERTVEIEQFGPVTHEDWQDKVPAAAKNISCTDKYQRTSSEPAPKATEVCGTPYTVDQGDGTGKVIQDCEYQVYAAYCKYTVDAWAPVSVDKLVGGEEPPTWPEPQVTTNQRAGERGERYRIIFDVDGNERPYDTSDANIYNNAAPGTSWTLEVNGLGDIVAISLAK